MTWLRIGLRELSRAKGRAGLLALLLALQAAALGGGFIAFDSLFHTRDVYYEQLRFADLTVQFTPADESELPNLDDLRAIPGVEGVTRRFVASGFVERADREVMPVVVHYLEPDERPEVNDLQVQSGHYPRADEPQHALVDRSFAEHGGVKLGERLVVNPHSFPAKFEVTGLALSPEYLVPTANPDVLIPQKGSLGIIYAPRAQLDELFAEPLYNQLAIRYDNGADTEATTAAVMAALGGLDIERTVPRSADFGYRYVEEILGGSRLFMPMTASIIAFLAALVAFVAVSRIIASRRREIGALLALGWPRRRFIAAFSLFGIVPGLIGGGIGAAMAIGFGRELAFTNADIAGLPEPIFVYSASSLVIAGLSALIVGLLSATIPVLSVLRLHPAEALRGGNDVAFRGVPRLFEPLLRRMRPPSRYAFRNLFRRPALSIATVVLISLAIALPAALLTSIASWKTWAADETASLPWDAAVSFRVPLDEGALRPVLETPGMAEVEGHAQGFVTMRRDGLDDAEVRLRGLPVPSKLHDIDLVAGTGFSAPDAAEIILNTSFSAGGRPPKLGETIVVEKSGRSETLTVVGLVSDASMSLVRTPIETAQAVLDQKGKIAGLNVVYTPNAGDPSRVALPPVEDVAPAGPRPEDAEVIDIDIEDVSPETEEDTAAVASAYEPPSTHKGQLFANEMVSSVEEKTAAGESMLDYMSAFNAVVAPFVVLGGAVAFLFLICVLGFLLLEREGEYATLRAFGFGRAEITRLVYTEVLVLSAIGIVLSSAAWVGLSYLLRDLMAAAWFAVPVDFRWFDIAIVAVPTLIFLGIAAVPGIRNLLRLELAASLRARALG